MPDLRNTPRNALHHYQVFGITIRSVLPLPLSSALPCEPDVEILVGEVPQRLQDATRTGIRYQARPGELLFKVDGVACYWIIAGRRILILQDHAAHATEDDVRVFLLGSAFGALLQQRGMLVLHGSAVNREGVAVAFLGSSGVGKSTLAMAFAQRGWSILTDEFCVIARDEAGALRVHAGFQQARLWPDSLEQLQLDPNELPRVRSNLQKRILPLNSKAAGGPLPLRSVYVLQTSNRPTVRLERLTGPKRFSTLRNQTYCLPFAAGLGMLATQFQQTLQLAQQASVTLVHRSSREFRLAELCDCIEVDCCT